MKELKEILNKIIEVYNTKLDNDEKHELLSKLWTSYYKMANKLNIESEEAYNLYLIGENESYIIDQKPVRKNIDNALLEKSVAHVKEIVSEKKKEGLEKEEVSVLLDWAVEHTRNCFEILGLDIKNASLNGFCELGQALSIMPFEKLGLTVTKNKAKDAFDYPFNHAFGTVTFPLKENEKITNVTYLIDTTYRQFFTSVRCNEGRYYTKEENLNIDTAPDPGYFIEDKQFAKELLGKGYIILNEDTARIYGEAFLKASRTLLEKEKTIKNINYYEKILKTSTNYTIPNFELDGFDLEFPLPTKKSL